MTVAALQAKRIGSLQPPSGYPHFLSAGVGPSDDIAIVWTSEIVPELISSPLPSQPIAVTVHAGAPGLALRDTIHLTMSPEMASKIQPLHNGDVLVVGDRCAWSADDGAQINARVFDATGKLQREGVLGDGIAHAVVDSAGRIWTGYFDEGIFGNLGWGWGDGPKPLGSAGVVRWTADFERDWTYRAVEKHWFADCETLNVDDETVWICADTGHYAGFCPLICIRDTHASVLRTTPEDWLQGFPCGLVVSDGYVGLMNPRDNGHTVLMSRRDDLAHATEHRLLLPDGSAVRMHPFACRGSRAYFVIERDVFVLDLSEQVLP